MYAVYKQAHPPTGLEFAMYCNFFNNSERNLVVAGTSQLYVYRLNRDAEVSRFSGAEMPRPYRSHLGRFPRARTELCLQSLVPSADSPLPCCLASSYHCGDAPAYGLLLVFLAFPAGCCRLSMCLEVRIWQ